MGCDVMVIGCRGQLGRDLMESFAEDHAVVGVDIEECDIRDREQVLKTVSEAAPRVALHAAAYTDVDACESNPNLAMAVNGDGAGHVALACREVGARMVYFSTDYVFDGALDRPYTEDDPTNPRTVYGQSKLAGEEAVRTALDDYVILRIAWLYGRHGRNFVKTMIDLGRRQTQARGERQPWSPLRVVNNQFGTPCWTEDIARQTRAVLSEHVTGLFHATSEGETSWYEFARELFASLGWDVAVEPCLTAEFPRPAVRPRRSTLENARLKSAGLNVMPDWRSSLTLFLNEYREELIGERQD